MVNALIIHPIWVIDEYPNSVRRCVWFSPNVPPTNALSAATAPVKDIKVFEPVKGKQRSIKGASFCQVVSKNAFSHEIEVITEGNQKWHGAAPSFSNKARIRIEIHNEELGCITHKDILEKSIMAEPSAWARKYFIAASISWFDFCLVIIGINLSKLISMKIQAINQLLLIKANKDLAINVETTRKEEGVIKSIRTWRSRTP